MKGDKDALIIKKIHWKKGLLAIATLLVVALIVTTFLPYEESLMVSREAGRFGLIIGIFSINLIAGLLSAFFLGIASAAPSNGQLETDIGVITEGIFSILLFFLAYKLILHRRIENTQVTKFFLDIALTSALFSLSFTALSMISMSIQEKEFPAISMFITYLSLGFILRLSVLIIRFTSSKLWSEKNNTPSRTPE